MYSKRHLDQPPFSSKHSALIELCYGVVLLIGMKSDKVSIEQFERDNIELSKDGFIYHGGPSESPCGSYVYVYMIHKDSFAHLQIIEARETWDRLHKSRISRT